MSIPINLNPAVGTDGVPYSLSVPITFQEADLNGGTNVPSGPIPVEYGQTVVAVVQLSINGIIVGSNAYVVMQTLLGGQWIDLAWAVTALNQGTAVFVLSGGGIGAMNNAFQQTRQPGQFPASTGSNAVPLGGQVRFVGKATAVGGSSSLAGTTAGLSCTINYRLQAPR